MALRAGDAGRRPPKRRGRPKPERPVVAGRRDGTDFADFRDADDLWAGNFEVLTTTGKYFWIPTERVVTASNSTRRSGRATCSGAAAPWWCATGRTVTSTCPALYERRTARAMPPNDGLRLGRAPNGPRPSRCAASASACSWSATRASPMQQLTSLEFA